MTAQFSDRLINECAEVDFSELHLYGVLVGDIKKRKDIKPYTFLQKENPEKPNVFYSLLEWIYSSIQNYKRQRAIVDWI